MRRALSEPSSGSTITETPELAVAEGHLAALLGDRGELVALRVQRLQLGEDDVLAAPVDGERSVAALADAGVDGPGGDPVLLGEQLAMGRDDPPAGGEPVRLDRVARRRRRLLESACAPPRPC